jgi:hypothetical protein
MATRSTIALEYADGTVQQVYSHWDGYINHNGKILLEKWSDPFKLQRLIDLGSVSQLSSEIGTAHPFSNPHSYGTAAHIQYEQDHKHMTTFYCRDRGEDLSIHTFKDFEDYERNHQYEEYEYILRNVNGVATWFVCSYESDGYEPLTEVMKRIAERLAEECEE